MAIEADHASERQGPLSDTLRGWSILGILWATWCFLTLSPGALILDTHGGDALHTLDILERMAMGQVPHRDFITPIGQLAFTPIAALIRAGLPAGQAFLLAQAGLGALLATAAYLNALRRLPWPAATGFAAVILILTMALVHGGSHSILSISMYYNRWCWALAFIAILTAVLPPTRPSHWDSVILGAALTAIALIKLTYLAACVPLVILGLSLSGQTRALPAALATALTIAAAWTVAHGWQVWGAYLHDVWLVAQSDLRVQPGAGFWELLTAPSGLATTVMGVAAIVLLIRAGQRDHAMLLAALLAAGSYITYQNYANDPLHLGLAATVLAAWTARASTRHQMGLLLLAAGLAASIAPSYVNLASSPVRAARLDPAAHRPLLTGPRHSDILVSGAAASDGHQLHIVTDGHRGFPGTAPDRATEFQGQTLPNCTSPANGAHFAAMAADLADRGLAQGEAIFVADVLNPLWLYGDHPPLAHAMPWYYGGLHGLTHASFVLLPLCPNSPGTWHSLLTELEDTTLTEIARSPLYILYQRAV